MHDHMRTARRDAFLLVACLLPALAVLAAGAAAFGRGAEVRLLVEEGKPREVAECMVQIRHTWGECEVGMFTGTYPAEWDSAPELVKVRDAVRRVRAVGGSWAFAHAIGGRSWSVCAVLPGRAPRCSTDVQSAAALAFGEPTRGEKSPGVLAVSPARRRLCTAGALASLRRRAAGARGAAAQAELAERTRACGATPS
jgi:hypothetical protein